MAISRLRTIHSRDILLLFVILTVFLLPSFGLAAQTATESASCWYTWSFDDCIWQPLTNALGTLFLTIGGSLLLLAGTLFDEFVKYLIVDLQTTITTTAPILDGLKIGWQFFRDVANIGIIGIFVFVAIMTILGSADYGAKRLVANVLVVAVLINFSLLFTQIIIGGTNFVSGQFWKAMPAAVQTTGTAESFLKAFGMEGTWSETSLLVERAGGTEKSGWAALLYGLFGGLALTAVAAVLLYGSFVIAARFLLLIFAMLTSSIAFASFLLPRSAGAQPYIGWSAWWSNLLKAAFFGPFLMIFLWITIQLISEANTSGAGAAIGKIAYDPSQAGDAAWQSIILLMIGTGMLFLAIKSAGSFASSIGGYSELKFGLGAALALSARGTGFLGRAGIGRGAAALDRLNDNRLSAARVKLANLENEGKASRWELRAARMDVKKFAGTKEMLGGLAKSSFNATNTSLGKDLVKKLGAGSFVGGKVDSFGARAEKQAKEAEKRSKNYALTNEEKNAVVDQQKKALYQQKESSERQLAVAQKTLEAVRSTPEHKTHQNEEKAIVEEMKRISIAANKEINDARGDEKKIGEIRKARDGNLSEQEEKIKTVRNNIVSLEKGALEDLARRKEEAAKLSDKGIKNTVNENNINTQREAAARYAAGEFGSTNSTVANMARDLVKKAKEEKDEGHHLLKALKREMEHGHDGDEGHKDEKKADH